MTQNSEMKGRVIIAGAGPGDPELITLKALRAVQEADVIVVDRLVSDEILKECRPNAVVLFAGKQGRNDQSVSQTEINALLVAYASTGNLVVRLKGGDVSIFSNLLDELETLTAHSIPYEIIPGVTAASGAAAMAGIPLTARGHSTAVRFLTAYKPELISEKIWKDLASTDDTLVLYMSAGPLDLVVGKLLDHRIGSDKFIAIIEQATTPQQRVEVLNVYEYESRAKARMLASPTLIIIGSICGRHSDFKWQRQGEGAEYFRSLRTKLHQPVPFLTQPM